MDKTVFVVDDNEDDIFFAQISVERCGQSAELRKFYKATEALEFLATQPHGKPTLVLLDINMPGMSGFDFLEAFEKLPPECRAQVMIVMLTSSSDASDRQRAFSYPSVKDYVRKPIERNKMASLIQTLDSIRMEEGQNRLQAH